MNRRRFDKGCLRLSSNGLFRRDGASRQSQARDRGRAFSAFSSQVPVGVKKTRKDKDLEPRPDLDRKRL
jgi:hypothetical protein